MANSLLLKLCQCTREPIFLQRNSTKNKQSSCYKNEVISGQFFSTQFMPMHKWEPKSLPRNSRKQTIKSLQKQGDKWLILYYSNNANAQAKNMQTIFMATLSCTITLIIMTCCLATHELHATEDVKTYGSCEDLLCIIKDKETYPIILFPQD